MRSRGDRDHVARTGATEASAIDVHGACVGPPGAVLSKRADCRSATVRSVGARAFLAIELERGRSSQPSPAPATPTWRLPFQSSHPLGSEPDFRFVRDRFHALVGIAQGSSASPATDLLRQVLPSLPRKAGRLREPRDTRPDVKAGARSSAPRPARSNALAVRTTRWGAPMRCGPCRHTVLPSNLRRSR